MSLVPEYLYPSVPYSLNTTPALRTGLNWMARSSDSVWSTSFQLYDPLTDTIEFDIETNTTRDTGAHKTILEWENGVYMDLIVWYYQNTNVYARCALMYDGTELTQTEYASIGADAFYSSTYDKILSSVQEEPGSSSTKLVIPFAFAPVCEWYPQADPTENVTPAVDLAMQFFFPTMAAGKTSISTSEFTGSFNLRNLYLSDTENLPWPVAIVNLSTSTNAWTINDLTAFNTGMKSLGNGMDTDAIRTDTEPGADDDTSHTGGGGGAYDDSSDSIDIPDLPTGGALTSGMIKGFIISSSALVTLQNKLWDMSIFDISTQFQKLVNQPLDCLISLHCLPVLPSGSDSEEVKLGSFETDVYATRIDNQYVEVDCGTLAVPKYWGSALDYAPYSNAELFLPFIGIRHIKIEDIQGLTVAIVYHVDVLTGDCVAYVKCGTSVLYSFTGNCLQRIPCTSSTSDRLAHGIAAVGSIGLGMATGNPASTAGGVISGITNVASAKNHVQRSGDVAGSTGIMSEFVPYMIYHRPAQSLAQNYNKFKGYPCNITYTLRSLSGYTEVEHVHLTGITGATDTELNEIEQLLKSGVII